MTDDTNDVTAAHLISALDLLASTRSMVTATDWTDPQQVAVAEHGIADCLGVVMVMLGYVADGLGCRSEADQSSKSATDRTWSMIAMHQNGGTA